METATALKPSELKGLLLKTIPARLPVLIKGAPGLGKTDIVGQAAAALSARLQLKHPVVDDPIDYKGLGFKVEGRDEARFLPFGDLKALIDADTPTVCFLDDLGQAPPAVQAAAMQLLLSRSINGHRVSERVCFVAATNRRTDRAGVSGILEPVKSRFATIVELQPDLEDWVAWALSHDMPTELIAFVRYRPNLLWDFAPTAEMTNSPCPRTVANAGRLLNIGLPPEVEYQAVSGAAGEGFAAELLGFLRIYRKLPHPDRVLQDPDRAPVPADDPATLYALCGA
ncbi:MAG: ATP-binding protein, partial [Desulfobacteraceae bacterium]|nr:ATP-binding protein [Desulfobacteraceae bacterium]